MLIQRCKIAGMDGHQSLDLIDDTGAGGDGIAGVGSGIVHSDDLGSMYD